MQYLLKDIAQISTGITFRSKVEPIVSGAISVIQMKDLGDDNVVHLEQLVRIENVSIKSAQLAKVGDIIFRSRGQTNTGAIVVNVVPNLIVAAPLFRIRPNTAKVLPDYLLWWLNQSTAQAYFSANAEGSGLKMISKAVLAKLEVELPNLQQQHKITELFKLSMQERNLSENLRRLKQINIQHLLFNLASQDGMTFHLRQRPIQLELDLELTKTEQHYDV